MQIKSSRSPERADAGEPRPPARRSIMARLLDRMDALMVAIAFAEAGEADTARRILAERRRDDRPVRR